MKQNPSDTLKVYQANSEQLSLKEIFEDLKQISAINKCSFCGCNIDTLKEFAELAKANGRRRLAKKADKLRVKIESQKKYDCLGCKICYPADISNLLFKISDGTDAESKQDSCASESCSCETKTSKDDWPVERGNYFVGNRKESIAINTLSNTKLPKQLAELLGDTIAIVGYCETENTGIEKIVKNIISNPNIRTLIVCGYESGQDMMGGHFSGQALLSLYSNGMTEKNRIIGAKGKRPIVKNLRLEQVERFQSQVEIVELIGNNSMDDIIQTAKIAHSKRTVGIFRVIMRGA